MTYPTWIDATERRIISKLIDTILSEGCTIRVHDGEEWAMDAPTDKKSAITSEVAATDCTVLAVYQDGKKVGQYVLIHGNGNDVISDWAWNSKNPDAEQLMERLAAPAGILADTIA